ncbi:MAG: thioredoxin-dependent thiol peroxidase [Micrococcales bacterium]|nr:thioredoxin-dependent thiol peroxidase [Micrococcales bacterium]
MLGLNVGDAAPDFTLTGADGQPVTLSDLRGQSVVVYFYPRASTPGCTRQACDFRDSLASLTSAGYQVLGISPDPVARLAKFVEAQQLTFPLLSDPDHQVMERWGAWGPKTTYGKQTVGVIRSTVVVGADQTVTWARYNVKATGHVALLRRELGLD